MRPFTILLSIGLLGPLAFAGCNSSPTSSNSSSATAPAAAPAASVEKGGQEEYGPYELVENWPQPLQDAPDGVKHDGWTWGSVGAVYAETPDRIWIAQRGELPLPAGAKPWTPYSMLMPSRGNATGNGDGLSATCEPVEKRGWERRYHHAIMVMDREGKMVQWWNDLDKIFEGKCGRGPHKIKMSPYDPDKHVWLIDDQLHVIYKFTYDGRLVMTLGTKGQRGRSGGKLFDRPTDIAWLPDGTFFVADGYAGTRVAKFDRTGKFLMDWGRPPVDPDKPGPNEFWSVHSIGISRDRRLFVADREHHRMQVFDENGKFLEMWPTGHDSAVLAHIVTQDDFIWMADWTTDRLVKYDLNGRYILDIGGHGPQPGQFDGVHQISVDQERNLYVTEVANNRSQKFRPKPDADPAKIVGPMVGAWAGGAK